MRSPLLGHHRPHLSRAEAVDEPVRAAHTVGSEAAARRGAELRAPEAPFAPARAVQDWATTHVLPGLQAATFGLRHAAVGAVMLGAAMVSGCAGLPVGEIADQLVGGAVAEAPLNPSAVVRPLAPAQIPAHASPLFRKIAAEVVGTTKPGTVPAHQVFTTRSWAESKVLINPEMIFKDVARRILSLRSELDIQNFRWSSDSDPVRQIFGALAQLQELRRAEGATQPIIVRLDIDSMPSGLNGNLPTMELFDDVRATIARYGLDPRLVDVRFAAHDHALLGAVHSKGFIFDGETLIVLGANLNFFDNWDYSVEREEPVNNEHDAGFVFHGEIARSALADYDDLWLKSRVWASPSLGGELGPVPHPSGDSLDAATRRPVSIRHDLPPLPSLGDHRPVPMMFVSKQPYDGLFAEQAADYPINRAVGAVFRNAESEVDFLTANLNEKDVMNEIVWACGRKVTVRAVLTKGFEDFSESLPGQGGTNAQSVKELYRRLEAANIPAERLQIRWSRATEQQPEPDVGGEYHSSHVKFISADRKVAMAMSLNLDTQSRGGARGIGVLVNDAATAQAWLDQLFEADFARGLPITHPEELGVNVPQLLRSSHILGE